MALKNHDLDGRILQAAQAEFLDKGYEAASLRKIAAAAGVTVGAIYTRWPTKDGLFQALVQPLLDRIGQAFSSIKGSYYPDSAPLSPAHMAQAMELESQAILHLLFDDYDRAVLLLCRSTGSSLEHVLDGIVEEKIRETLHFFRLSGVPHPDEKVLRLLVGGQFHMYFQIVRGGYDRTEAMDLMRATMVYHTGGWLTLLKTGNEHTEA